MTTPKRTPRRTAAPRERVRVVVRMRPHKDQPGAPPSDGGGCCSVEDGVVQVKRPFAEDRPFRFDGVLDESATQADAYDALAKPAVAAVIDGIHGTVMCYGQTGTGKTHTIFGAPDMDWTADGAGVVPRAVVALAEHVDRVRRGGGEAALTASFLQVYNETVDDLFDLHGRGLAVREDPKHGVYAEGLFQLRVESARDLLEAVAVGARSRVTAGTALNCISSRSHAVLTITLDQTVAARAPLGEAAPNGSTAALKRRSTLTIVDLAGSERVSKSRSSGARLQEAKSINRSISALGNCVLALADPARRSHVPLRESRLTRLLTNSLSGNAKTVLCATVAPEESNFDESFTTLQFASRAMAVQTHAAVNERLVQRKARPAAVLAPPPPPPPLSPAPGGRAQAVPGSVAAQVEALREELAAAHGQIAKLREESSSGGPTDQAPAAAATATATATAAVAPAPVDPEVAQMRAEIAELRAIVLSQQAHITELEAMGTPTWAKLGAALAAVPELRPALASALCPEENDGGP